ncbi:copia protein [Tanacetum coccineum]
MMNTRQVIWPIDDSLKSFIIEAIEASLASTMAVVNKTIEDQVNKSIADMNSSVNEFSRVNVENVTCEVYVEALLKRFCSTYEDPMSKLKNIRQKDGLVQVYIDAFDLLMTKVEVPETQAISFFLGGLDKEIEMSVRMLRPQTLVDACLSKLQVVNNNVSKRFTKALLTTPRYTQAHTDNFDKNNSPQVLIVNQSYNMKKHVYNNAPQRK